jgi:hypothetical protein
MTGSTSSMPELSLETLRVNESILQRLLELFFGLSMPVMKRSGVKEGWLFNSTPH